VVVEKNRAHGEGKKGTFARWWMEVKKRRNRAAVIARRRR